MKMCRCIAALAAISFILAGCGGSQGQNTGVVTTAQDTTAVQAYMDSLAAAGKFTGSVLVARGDDILLSKGYGWADIEKKVANTPQTKFRIGSNTKQFTAMAILLLEQQGKLNTADHLCMYITACPDAWRDITLKHLLTHTSGIPDYTNFSDFPIVIGTAVSVSDLIARFKNLPLNIAPGSRWQYSNSGYVLLGDIIEKTSGLSYADFLQSAIFTPLRMTHTGYDQSVITESDHAQGYLSLTRKPVLFDMSEVYAAGALYSTVEDLYIWNKALLNNRLVSAAVLLPMISAQIPCPASGCALASDIGYGYAWFIADVQQHRYIYHWGRIDGFISSNGFFPNEQVYVSVLSNLETSDVFQSSATLGVIAVNTKNN